MRQMVAKSHKQELGSNRADTEILGGISDQFLKVQVIKSINQ